MLAIRHSLVLVVALVSWPVLAQEPPAPAKGPIANVATKLAEFLSAPVSDPPISSKDPNPDKENKQDAESTQPKNGDPPGPVTDSPDLRQQEMLHPVWSGLAPLSEIGERSDTALRFGWWTTQITGTPQKIGEYQGLTASPFWEVNGLYSNGYRTLGFYGNQTDNVSNQANLHYFSPNWFADIDFQRFIHRRDHIPLDNFLPSNAINDKQQTPATTGYPGSKSLASKTTNNAFALGKDLNVGEDYAIRVEEFRASVGDKINDNLRFRVDAWQMRKFGERQGNATAHCFVASAGGTKSCHVLSQSQHIDWLTVEVTPRLEARFGPVTIEYSRPMRQFTQNDQVIYRDYQDTAGMINGTYPYAIAPQNTTQIDQLKGSIDLGPTRQFYAFGYTGATDNQDRDINRYFKGYDLRYTDWTLPRTSVTLYARAYSQTGTLPTTLLPDETDTGPLGQKQPLPKTTPETPPADYIFLPLEYHRNTQGIKASWRPDLHIGVCKDLAFTAGYECDFLGRENAVWQTPPRGPAAGMIEAQGKATFSQLDTTTKTVFVGVSKPWIWNIDTFVRYKVVDVDNPLFGVRQQNGVLNTGQPAQKNIVEFGGGWYPRGNFAITLQQDIEVGGTHFDNTAAATGNLVDYGEQTYSTTLTTWYAPTPKLSMVASASFYSNWINQNMFLGDNYFDSVSPPSPPSANLPLAIQPTFFTGTSELFNFHVNYQLTDNVRLSFGYQFVRGNNQFNMMANPSFAFPPSASTTEPLGKITFADLPRYSAVLVETQKVTAGISWRPRPLMTVYLNYSYFDYNDKTNTYNSGTAHMAMAGLSRIW